MSMQPLLPACSRSWNGDDPDPIGREGLDRNGRHRHAPGHERVVAAGAGGVPARSPWGDLYIFRGRRGDLIKVLWHDGLGMSLYSKRLEHGQFVWPSPADGTVAISAAQLAYMLDGIDWRNPRHTFRPQRAG